ncbi:MAG: hypothetical protein ACYC5O_20895 [Anaerolineae bacterium]
MTGPALLFAFLVATAVAALYHLLFGRNLRQLAVFWVASLVGFAIGQVLGAALPAAVPHIGQVHIIEGIVVAVVLVTIVRYLRL